jgi:cytochrome c peroxidase
MTVRTSLALALGLALGLATLGCKKEPKGNTGAATGTGSATGSAGTGGAMTGDPAMTRPSQGTLAKLEDPTWDADPTRDQKVALGHVLFFDNRLSVDGSRSCYSCHLNEDGNGGHDPLAIGAGDKPLTRHSPVIWNVAFFDKTHSLYWDGRSANLEDLTKAAWSGGNMGVGSEAGKLDAKAAEIAKIKGYAPLLTAAFPDVKPAEIKADHLASALATYQRTLICKDTAYDRFAGGDKAALNEPQQRGLDLFLGKGQCTVCHAPPYFSTAMVADGGFFANTGVGTQKPEAEVDVGRFKITNKPEDWAAFKPPSLRNVSKSAPYFHDGSVATLDAAVQIMAIGGIPNKAKSPLLANRGLTPAEITDLIAFLGSLDCPGKLEEPAAMPK